MTPLPSTLPPGLNTLLGTLRVAGLEVGPRELLRLHQVLRLEPRLDRDVEGDAEEVAPTEPLRILLRTCLVHSLQEGEVFDQVFSLWAARWEGWSGGGPAPTRGAAHASAPQRLAEVSVAEREFDGDPPGNIFRQMRIGVRLAWLMVVALTLLPIVPVAEPVPIPPPEHDDPLPISDSEFKILDLGAPPSTLTLYRPKLEVLHEAPRGPSWPHLFFGGLALVFAGALAWRYRHQTRLPEILPAPTQPGPARLPLLPFRGEALELVQRRAARTLVWGVGRHVSENLTRELDLEGTVRATAAGGGLPELRYAPEMRLREVWLWLDGSARDPALLERWAGEIAESLSRAGLPVRLGGFDGVPEELQWDTGQPFHPRHLEAHRQTALVAVLTDGAVLRSHLADARRGALAELLHALGKWPRLVFADFSEGHLAQDLRPFGLTCLAPSAVPAFFGLGRTTAPPVPEPDPGELRAWRAALALGGRPVERATAWALRRELGLEVSSWCFHRLAEGDGVGQVGGGLGWQEEHRQALVAWLAEGSLARTAGVREGSLLAKALDFWQRRLQSEAEERQRRGGFEAWQDSPAARYLRMEQGLLQLWREPREAAKVLWELRQGELAERLRQRLSTLAPRDCRSSDDGLIPLPWRRSEVDDATLYLLTQLGLGGVTMGDLQRPGRLVAGLGLLLSLGLGLVVVGFLPWELGDKDSLPVGIEFTELQGGTFQMGSVENDPLALPNEKPAHEVKVGLFWMATTEITNAQFGRLPPDHVDADKPVVKVNWKEARGFCRSLESAGDWMSDLPTEAEWEYAARAGTSTPWSFGEDEESLGDYSWFSENSEAEAHEVATRKANPWGLYDMHGNV